MSTAADTNPLLTNLACALGGGLFGAAVVFARKNVTEAEFIEKQTTNAKKIYRLEDTFAKTLQNWEHFKALQAETERKIEELDRRLPNVQRRSQHYEYSEPAGYTSMFNSPASEGGEFKRPAHNAANYAQVRLDKAIFNASLAQSNLDKAKYSGDNLKFLHMQAKLNSANEDVRNAKEDLDLLTTIEAREAERPAASVTPGQLPYSASSVTHNLRRQAPHAAAASLLETPGQTPQPRAGAPPAAAGAAQQVDRRATMYESGDGYDVYGQEWKLPQQRGAPPAATPAPSPQPRMGEPPAAAEVTPRAGRGVPVDSLGVVPGWGGGVPSDAAGATPPTGRGLLMETPGEAPQAPRALHVEIPEATPLHATGVPVQPVGAAPPAAERPDWRYKKRDPFLP